MSGDDRSPNFGSVTVHQDAEITVGHINYLLILNPDNFLEKAGLDATSHALALVYPTTPGESVSVSSLREFRTKTLEPDDVFQSDFATNLIFYGSDEKNLHIEPDTAAELKLWNVKRQYTLARDESLSAHSVAPGPVVVPSRCYYKPTEDRPLAGARIGVKDNIDIAGHKTTLCNRSWMDLYPSKTQNAACIQTLIDAGAIIVGKLKLQAMIMREEPLECVEFTAPFNPRADGYQVPSGSSNGSGASIASYDWLDFSIGSDTNGSGRKPASYNGCFSIRPSTGIINTDGVVGYFPQFDMPVFFGRDISKFPDFISTWYGDSPMLRSPDAPTVEILYPTDYLPTLNPEQTQRIERFVSGLESTLQISRRNISLADMWKQDCPDGNKHDDIAKYLETKYGRPAFVHRALHWQWEVGKAVSKEERDEGWRRSEVYRHWMLSKVFKADSQDTVVVMPLPIEAGQPNYRDAPLPPREYSLLSGYAALNMSNLLRAPEVTAPGQFPESYG
ncbi:amidase [Cordyceps fumosorosea ARSEF 2679]|uniref:Amidase n=1 Tax=Cordyceps fumosorosea (strain ARSEF 2679) TaxID=1081104 RepID=A0A162MTT5_CORFA|nr:amidase [Cordyceps fumosorosea ARSEF 2679]OAA70229.1 amidase [Cordyceps fumosorosea ARSEF 2679]